MLPTKTRVPRLCFGMLSWMLVACFFLAAIFVWNAALFCCKALDQTRHRDRGKKIDATKLSQPKPVALQKR